MSMVFLQIHSSAFVRLFTLSTHLLSFQALQQQQEYEGEAVKRDIEHSCNLLLKNLSEYKGEQLVVISKAEVFAGMKVEDDDELLLPPYPTPTPSSHVLDTTFCSRFSNPRKLVQNGLDSRDDSKKSQAQNSSNKLWVRLGCLVTSTAKTMLTLVDVIALLSLAGFTASWL